MYDAHINGPLALMDVGPTHVSCVMIAGNVLLILEKVSRSIIDVVCNLKFGQFMRCDAQNQMPWRNLVRLLLVRS